MTLVIESAVALAPLVYSLHTRAERDAAEKRVAADVYSRYFHRDLWEHSPERSTSLSGNLPTGLDGHAAASIRIIEKYQEDRKQWWGVMRSAESAGDTRVRILEELKQWCLTVSADTMLAADVSTRLEYCRRLLLYPSVFPRSNQTSFLDTIAEVCLHLERLLKQTMAAQRSGLEQLAQIVRLGREVARLALPVLLFTLPDERAVPARAEGKGPPDPIQVADVLQSAAAARQLAPSQQGPPCVVNWRSGVGSLLLALLSSAHARDMLSGADEPTSSGSGASTTLEASEPPPQNPAENIVQTSASSSSAPPSGSAAPVAGFPAVLGEVRSRWASAQVGAEVGLLSVFCGPGHAETRSAFLDLCAHLDRVLFFMQALLPYQRLVSMAGDIALCWLRKSLGHLLQELEKALVQLRQSRLEVMRAVKKELQGLAKLSSTARSAEQTRWMQGLRHVDEVRLDRLHQDLSAHCTEVRMASTLAREVELQGAARRGLGDIAASLSSADFQARCSLRLPDRLLADMRQMALTSG